MAWSKPLACYPPGPLLPLSHAALLPPSPPPQLAEVALNLEPFSYDSKAAAKASNPNRRRKWLIPLVLAAQVRAHPVAPCPPAAPLIARWFVVRCRLPVAGLSFAVSLLP